MKYFKKFTKFVKLSNLKISSPISMCRCAVRQAMDVSKDGMMTSGYGAEDTWKIHGVSPVGNKVVLKL